MRIAFFLQRDQGIRRMLDPDALATYTVDNTAGTVSLSDFDLRKCLTYLIIHPFEGFAGFRICAPKMDHQNSQFIAFLHRLTDIRSDKLPSYLGLKRVPASQAGNQPDYHSKETSSAHHLLNLTNKLT